MSKNNNINALRDHLFDVIERLKANNDPDADPKDGIDIETAREITNVAKVLVDSAKVEATLLKENAKANAAYIAPSQFLLGQ